MKVGIVGLPNVGKSSLFNILTAGSAKVDLYPFTTIEKNVGVVLVPDDRLEQIGKILKPEKLTDSRPASLDILKTIFVLSAEVSSPHRHHSARMPPHEFQLQLQLRSRNPEVITLAQRDKLSLRH